MKLIRVQNNHLSLEFDPDQRSAVERALQELDINLQRRSYPGSMVVRVCGVELVLDADPLSLALISSNDAGDQILERVLKACEEAN